MLINFEIENFKSFEKKLCLNLSNPKNYTFNPECIKNNSVRKALIYGPNGVGKSNLGFAIMDMVSHLTDKSTMSQFYENYINALNPSVVAEFRFEFKFSNGTVIYSYGKTNQETLVYEDLDINGQKYAFIDRRVNNVMSTSAAGAENLIRDVGDSKISIISYIEKNTVLVRDKQNLCFYEFLSFVNGMLFFRSLEGNHYIGLEQGRRDIAKDIVERGNLDDFQDFLNKAGIECELSVIGSGDEKDIAFIFGEKLIPFYEVASQGTRSLSLFYFWLQRLKEESKVSFVFIDEFDAFYHHKLSELIVEELKKVDAQIIITTHNTSIMSNDVFRPDCYFLIDFKKGVCPISSLSEKELREAHNIEKMYRAGSFNG